MIKFISKDDILPIRNEILREGKLILEQCRFDGDDNPESFHLGFFDGEVLVSIASFHPQGYGEFAGKAYQLRGMATLHSHQGKGLGTQLINFAIVYLRGQKVNYVWCNARQIAVNFYSNVGFEVVSKEFDIPGIGPHFAMYLKIQ